MTVRPWPEPADEPEPETDPAALTDEQIDALSEEELADLLTELREQTRPPWGLVCLAAALLLWVAVRVQVEVNNAAFESCVAALVPSTELPPPCVAPHQLAWTIAKLVLATTAAATGAFTVVRSRRWRAAAGAGLGATAWWLTVWALDGIKYGVLA